LLFAAKEKAPCVLAVGELANPDVGGKTQLAGMKCKSGFMVDLCGWNFLPREEALAGE
jgi:hypothetical protein